MGCPWTTSTAVSQRGDGRGRRRHCAGCQCGRHDEDGRDVGHRGRAGRSGAPAGGGVTEVIADKDSHSNETMVALANLGCAATCRMGHAAARTRAGRQERKQADGAAGTHLVRLCTRAAAPARCTPAPHSLTASNMGRKSRAKRERRLAKQAEQRRATPEQRYPANTEYIQPTDAATSSEGYLRQLCKRTFLSLWSYPSPFRDQGPGHQNGKEVCDLLVVFENNIIIFSDKHCDFPNSGNLALDWSRWYRRAIKAVRSSVVGCRAVDPHSPRQSIPGPEMHQDVPTFSRPQVHHIVSSDSGGPWSCPPRCVHELGGSGSLMLTSSVVGDGHTLSLAGR